MFCNDCHGEYKVREYWEAGRRFMYCQRCYQWFAKFERLVGRKPPAWTKLQHPIDVVGEQCALVLAIGSSDQVPKVSAEHVIGTLALVPA